jgi:opacity protein-like surface antigen
MKKTVLLGVLAAAGLAGSAQAQATLPTTPVSVEVRAGAGFPTGDLADIVKTGYNVGANVSVAVSPLLGVYGGYAFNSYSAKDDGSTDGSAHFRVEGPEAGVKLNIPAAGGVAPFIKGAALYQKYSVSVSGSGASGSFSDNQYRWGFEAGAGVAIPLGNRLSVTPAVSYTKVEHATAVKADIGLSFHI